MGRGDPINVRARLPIVAAPSLPDKAAIHDETIVDANVVTLSFTYTGQKRPGDLRAVQVEITRNAAKKLQKDLQGKLARRS